MSLKKKDRVIRAGIWESTLRARISLYKRRKVSFLRDYRSDNHTTRGEPKKIEERRKPKSVLTSTAEVGKEEHSQRSGGSELERENVDAYTKGKLGEKKIETGYFFGKNDQQRREKNQRKIRGWVGLCGWGGGGGRGGGGGGGGVGCGVGGGGGGVGVLGWGGTN